MYPDIVDIKPANMEDLAEVITAAEFHPKDCSTLVLIKTLFNTLNSS